MTDIIERAEALLQTQRFQSERYAGAAAAISELVAALKTARADGDRLQAERDHAYGEFYQIRDELNVARAENKELRSDAEMWRGVQQMFQGRHP